MTNGNDTRAAAPPSTLTFADALRSFEEARRHYETAKEGIARAQHDQAVAINHLPQDQQSDMAQTEAVGDRLHVGAQGDEAFAAMEAADDALEALMAIPATTPALLAAKMEAHFSAPWETGDHTTALVADAARVAAIASRSSPEWDAALADYLAKEASAVGAADDDADAAVDAQCRAQDHLVLSVPAPSHDALLTKVRLSFRRWEHFKFPDDFADAIRADVDRLFPVEARHAA